ncbi:MAG: ACP phosphodiesterase [Gemmataceae bacterium]
MNLLAHALLAGPGAEVCLGNVLADFVKGRDRRTMPPAFREGVRQHQSIDAFTDMHAVVSQSKARIGGYPHLTGILVDVFYDHFLTLRWDRYSSEPLGDFTARLYATLRSHRLPLPATAQAVVDRIVGDDWLGSYGSIAGVEDTLCRISRSLEARIGRDFRLGEATVELRANFDDLDRDFAEFFPQLQAHVATIRTAEPYAVADRPHDTR